MNDRPAYRDAVAWLVLNDDCCWFEELGNTTLTVAAALVCDLWGVSALRLETDLRDAWRTPGARTE